MWSKALETSARSVTMSVAPGATLVVTLRADVSSAFDHMTPVGRLYAHAGIALF